MSARQPLFSGCFGGFVHPKVVKTDNLLYICSEFWCRRRGDERRTASVKRESGENPEQSRCCKPW